MRALPSTFVLNALTSCVLLSLSAGAFAQQDPPPPPAPPAPPAAIVATTPLQPGAAAAAPAAERPDPAAPKSYAEVSRGTTVIPGFFKLLKKDDKVYVEVRPDQLEKPFFFTVNTAGGVGERGLYGSQMGMSQVAMFKKIGNHVQLIAKNTDYVAKPGTPQAHAVAQAFSDSLLASAPAASAPHPQTKAFLVEANALLFGDIPNYLVRLEFAYRMPFAFDAKNTSFTKVRADDTLTGFHVNAHYAVPKLSAPPLVTTPVTLPTPPTTTPDARSMFLGFYYSFAPLPAVPMAWRKADDRIGHFVSSHDDFTEDLAPKTARHAVSRWRLEKKDPSAALSEPVEPIVYWLDKNIPEKYRKSIADGVLVWNDAFEKIGFKNAVVVKQQTEADDFDTMDARHASIRWFVGSDVGFAIGPRRVDPRSGEILDADIGMSDVFARGARRMVNEDGALPTAAYVPGAERCDMAVEGAQEMGFAMGLLEARGEFEPGSPQSDAVAQAYVRAVIAHEIGHTLGLRHNFRSSTIHTLAQLQDTGYTQKNGLAGSVMDYTPFNLAIKGEKQGEYVQSALGPYDYWAIEYAYKPIAPEQESAELARIAGRSSEPLLAYGTDEDAGGNISDPDVNVFDLGSDPLAYVQK
ncbi:MAG TPA: zinc-dependent metalloprotease, partial [Burkholderiaceae bacterium]